MIHMMFKRDGVRKKDVDDYAAPTAFEKVTIEVKFIDDIEVAKNSQIAAWDLIITSKKLEVL
jgi:hypothetical protein